LCRDSTGDDHRTRSKCHVADPIIHGGPSFDAAQAFTRDSQIAVAPLDQDSGKRLAPAGFPSNGPE
jgi:hypothetical protein